MSSIDWDELLKTADHFEPVPEGTYDVIVKSAEAGETHTGKDKITAKFSVEGGPHNGRTITWINVLSPVKNNGEPNTVGLAIWFRQMGAFGMKANFFKTNPSMETIAQTMEGRKARVSVELEEFRGREQTKVKNIEAPVGGAQEVTVADVNDPFDASASSANKGDDIPF